MGNTSSPPRGRIKSTDLIAFSDALKLMQLNDTLIWKMIERRPKSYEREFYAIVKEYPERIFRRIMFNDTFYTIRMK